MREIKEWIISMHIYVEGCSWYIFKLKKQRYKTQKHREHCEKHKTVIIDYVRE